MSNLTIAAYIIIASGLIISWIIKASEQIGYMNVFLVIGATVIVASSVKAFIKQALCEEVKR